MTIPSDHKTVGAIPARTRPSGDPSGDRVFDIRIAADGQWSHEGDPIDRQSLVRLFAGILKRDAAGGYWLETPAEKGRITVDDAPFVIVEMKQEGTEKTSLLHFRTNLDVWIVLGPEHPLRVSFNPETGEPRPYILVRDNLEALINRAVYYQLADLAEDAGGRIGVWSNGAFFPLDQGQES